MAFESRSGVAGYTANCCIRILYFTLLLGGGVPDLPPPEEWPYFGEGISRPFMKNAEYPA